MSFFKKNSRFKKKNFINFLVIIVLIMVPTSMARFKTAFESPNNVRVASGVIVFNLQDGNNLSMMGPIDENDQALLFEVTNVSNNNVVAEVTMKYNVEVDGLSELPLIYKLYKYNDDLEIYEEVVLTDNLSDFVYFLPDTSSVDKYKLDISWDNSSEEYLDPKYSKVIDYVKIRINCEQVD